MLNSTSDRNRWKRSESLEAIGIAGSDRNRWQRSESLEDDGFRGYPNGMAARRSNPRRQTCCSTLAGLPPPFEQRAHLRAATHCLANFSAFALPPGGQRHTLPGQTRPGREFSPGPGPAQFGGPVRNQPGICTTSQSPGPLPARPPSPTGVTLVLFAS